MTKQQQDEKELQEGLQKQNKELERIAAMTQDEARQMLVDRIQKDAYHEAAATVREIEAKAREEGEKKAATSSPLPSSAARPITWRSRPYPSSCCPTTT